MTVENDPRHICILVHERDNFEYVNYLLKEMSACWRNEGMRVSVQYGPAAPVKADLLILHVNLTVIPPRYLDFAQRYPHTINASVSDISKRSFSRNIVRRGDGWGGPVIVKTNRNFRGMPEVRIAKAVGGLAHHANTMRNKLPWGWHSELPEYRIFPSQGDVPAAVWWNRGLVAERFLPEREGDFYCLRTWTFLGDRETHSRSFSNEAIIKADHVIKRELLAEVPADLRRMRAELGFDYGKFDYALVDGVPVLYDVNKTPALGAVSGEFKTKISMLAAGIQSFL
jgi:hypothetical protein